MIEKLKNIKLHVTFSALMSIIIGILLVIYKGGVITAAVKVIGVLLVLVGITMVVTAIFSAISSYFGMAIGGIVGVIGIWMFVNPEPAVEFIPMVFGVILVVHGLQDLSMAWEIKRVAGKGIGFAIGFGTLNIILGAVCILMAFKIVNIFVWLIGIMLIVEGVCDCFVVHKVNRANKDVVVDVDVISEEDIEG